MDASDHDWFEGRGPRCHLHLVIDDATSKIYSGYFCLEETTEGYFKTCQSYFEKHGLPRSIYVDKRGTFSTEPKQTQFLERQTPKGFWFVALKKNSYQKTKTIGQKSLMVKKSSKTYDQKMRKGIISICANIKNFPTNWFSIALFLRFIL